MSYQVLSFKEALDKAMQYSSRKEYNSHQMMKKIISWGCSEDDTKNIIEVLVEQKFIDDQRYTEAFVRDKLRLAKWGRVKISYMLKMQGIRDSIIRDSMTVIDQDEYLQLLKGELTKKSKSIKAGNPIEIKGKLYRFAAGRGFEPDVINEAIRLCIND
ncbi:MAG: RecX family transcriptional regulator [Bacteroidales bacterium]|jgi:regulatory protein|nr:RecX family transcriptional regulator [Bacteroidales bacterium]